MKSFTKRKALAGILLFVFIFTALTGLFGQSLYAAEGVDKLWQLQYLMYADDDVYAFNDINNHWAEDAMLRLSYMDILRGFPDSSIKPGKNITRAEFVTMIVRALEIPITDTYMRYYKDIDISSWCYYSVSAAKRNGLLEVFSEESFFPDKIITREEMAVIAAAVLEADSYGSFSIGFSDIREGYKYYDYIRKVASYGIIRGMPDGSFEPHGNSTRAEASVIILRLLELRNPSKESTDAELRQIATAYEERLISYANENNSRMPLSLQSSIGREKGLNYIRANAITEVANKGMDIERNITDIVAKVTSKSAHLASVKLTYRIKVQSGNSIIEYRVFKNILMKKRNSKWLVYDSRPTYTAVSNVANDNFIFVPFIPPVTITPPVVLNPPAVSSPPSTSPPIVAAEGRINLVWHYMSGRTPKMGTTPALKGVNVISPTWFTLADKDGTIASIADIDYTRWAKKNGYKVWALLANDFEQEITSQMLNSRTARKKAIDSLISLSKTFEIDGINVDFENMYTKDRDAFTLFVKELYERAKQENLTISVDVTVIVANSNWSNCYDRAALAKSSDYIILMAYDQHWVGSPVSGSVAQLSWVEAEAKRVMDQVPKEKLVLGIPFYTRLWKEVYAPGSSKPTVTSKAISMEAAEQTIIDNKAKKVWDSVSGQYYATYQKDGATYKIWLEDERSIELKTKLVPKYSFAGVAAWRLGFEKASIWDTIDKALK